MLDKKLNIVLENLKNDINQLLGFQGEIPRINYGPCGVFALLFYEAWNKRFSNKAHICFVMTLDRSECDHIVVLLPSGSLYDGGIGVHSDEIYKDNLLIDEMLEYDHETLEKWAYGLDREYPRFCPNFDRKEIKRLIQYHLDRL